MQLDFCKIHGAGNDFIVIDDFSNEIELDAKQVSWLCDRHFGIGADGIILVRASKNADCVAYMHYINADGTLAEMCGNGVRCFAKFLVDKGFARVAAGQLDNSEQSGTFIADTLAGRRPISFTVDEKNLLVSATVDMGKPVYDNDTMELMLDTSLGKMRFYQVSMGNPHAVTFDASVWDMGVGDFAVLGSPLESNTSVFPLKSNIEFAELLDANNSEYTDIRMRVYERGVGETLACGTGACATVVAAVLAGKSQRRANVHLKGGVLNIDWRESDDHVFMTGLATTVFEGSVELPE